jgi:hypothetical protein
MLVLVLAFLVYFWLAVGAVQFLICVTTPRLRKYALSAALWWAVWGPCTVALLMMAGLMTVAGMIVQEHGGVAGLRVPHFPVGLGWGYVLLGALATAGVATAVAWLHQVVVRRFTFALFRLYVTAVSAGIGSVFGWGLSWWILIYGVRYGWVLSCLSMVVLVGGFGAAAYKGARALRGEAPTKWAWASKEEFEGVEAGSQ